MSDNERRLKQQLDSTTAALGRMEHRVNYLSERQKQSEYDDYDEAPPAGYDEGGYGEVDPNQLIMQAITTQAARQAATAVHKATSSHAKQEQGVKTRMTRLVADFPALAEDSSDLVRKSRQVYARINIENPGLDEATKYELAVREAAANIGARPVTLAPEDQDWTMPSGHNPALPTRQTKSRLTPEIIMNAKLMGINVDAKTKEGKLNLAELSEYSARFNADADERHLRYQ